MTPYAQPQPMQPGRFGRLPGVLALGLAVTLVSISMTGLAWFTDTLVGDADYGDVSSTSALIGPLGDLASGWFVGLFLLPTIPAALLLLTSLPRSRPTRITAGILWLIPAIGVLAWLPFETADEIRKTDEFEIYADNQTERVVTLVVVYLLFGLVMLLVARAAQRGRVVAPAVIGTVLATAAAAIHLVLMLALLESSGTEEVSVGPGLWVLTAGLLTLALAGWLLVSAASRFRTLAASIRVKDAL